MKPRLLLGFGGKPRHGKDYCVSAIKRAFPRVGTYSISELIAEELGIDRATAADLRPFQEHSERRRAEDPLYWSKRIWDRVKCSDDFISIVVNVRRWNEAEFYKDKRAHLVRVIRLNDNGSLYVCDDRDMNHVLETELDHYNWDFRIIAKGGQLGWLERQAIGLTNFLLGDVVRQRFLGAAAEQAPPHGDGADIASLVHWDLEQRIESGRAKYGQRLTGNNGRDPQMDLYQELLDAAVYVRQNIWERENLNA